MSPKLIYNIVCHPLYSRYVLYYMLLKQHSYIGCEFFTTNFQTTAYKICARYVQISCNDVNEKWHQIPYITLKHFGAARYELHVTKVFSMHIAVSTYFLGSEYMLYLQISTNYVVVQSFKFSIWFCSFLLIKTYSPKWIVTTVYTMHCSYYPFRWISL